MRIPYFAVFGSVLALCIFAFLASDAQAKKFRSSECASANWHKVGRLDGQQGRLPSRIKHYQRLCKKRGVSPDIRRYERGRHFGLRKFCTPSSGAKAGKSGRKYPHGCPPATISDFRTAYILGRDVYIAERAWRTNARKLDSLNRRRLTLLMNIPKKKSRRTANRAARRDLRFRASHREAAQTRLRNDLITARARLVRFLAVHS